MPQRVRFSIKMELFNQLIKSLIWYMKYTTKLSQNRFIASIGSSAFPHLDINNYESITDSDVLRMLADAYYDIFEIKHLYGFAGYLCEYKVESGDYKFQVVIGKGITDFTKTHYGYIEQLYPDVYSDSVRFKDAIQAFINIVDYMVKNKNTISKKSAYANHDTMTGNSTSSVMHTVGSDKNVKAIIPTYGSKCSIFRDSIDPSQYFVPPGCEKVYIELCGRTAISSILYMDCFDKIFCYEIDSSMCNFMNILTIDSKKLIIAIRRYLKNNGILDKEGKTCLSDLELRKKIAKLIDDMKQTLSNVVISGLSKKKKILYAAYVVLLTYFTYRGSMKNIYFPDAKKFICNIGKYADRVCYISEKLNKKGDNFIYKHCSWLKEFNKYKFMPYVMVTLDLPYPHAFGFPCDDYSKPFKWENTKEWLRQFKGAKCKTIMFCSDNLEFESAAISVGFKKTYYYDSQWYPKKGYRTIIFTMNISDSEANKIFVNLQKAD